jgi:branched-chain amino acid transport system substrate-binding protein
MRRYSVLSVSVAVGLLCGAVGMAHTQTGQARVDSSYGLIPEEYRPFSHFEDPYKEFFLTVLEYPGYGRNIPEPEFVETVKIGFIGPIMRSVSESYGGPGEVTLRVNQRQVRWDGYGASHLAPLGIKMLQGAQLAVVQANASGGYHARGDTVRTRRP